MCQVIFIKLEQPLHGGHRPMLLPRFGQVGNAVFATGGFGWDKGLYTRSQAPIRTLRTRPNGGALNARDGALAQPVKYLNHGFKFFGHISS